MLDAEHGDRTVNLIRKSIETAIKKTPAVTGVAAFAQQRSCQVGYVVQCMKVTMVVGFVEIDTCL